MCDGPCTEDFERGPYVFPDRLPRAQDGTADPSPDKKEPKPNRRGKRARKPSEDRMIRPSEDRTK